MTKYYRDLQPGETMQVGDERLEPATDLHRRQWQPVNPVFYGASVSATFAAEYRRPVNLPVLQRVTPEAIKELEGNEIRTIAVLSQGSAKTMTWNTNFRQWHSRAGHDNPLEWQWFIDLSTIPEVQQ